MESMAAARQKLAQDIHQYEQLCRIAKHQGALLMLMSMKHDFDALPESQQESLLCLASDMAMEIEEMVLGELP
jgi:hypothetical protein